MKNLSHFTAIALAALALSACTQQDEQPQNNTRTALTITTGTGTATRAEGSNWQKADAIGVYMFNTGTTTPSDADAPPTGYRYINQSPDGPNAAFSPADAANTAYFPTGKTEVDVIAYYPGDAPVRESMRILVDVSDQTNLPAIDLMTSTLSTGHSSDAPQVPLTFRHRLAKLVVKVVADTNFNGGQADVTAITLQGTPATARYDLMEQKIVDRGEVRDITLPGIETSQQVTAIVVPTPAGSSVAFKVNAAGGEYMAALPGDVGIEGGKETRVSVVLRGTGISISPTIEVKDWTDLDLSGSVEY